MGWVWTAVVVWVLLAVPAAVILCGAIRRADRQGLGELAPDSMTSRSARRHIHARRP